MTKSWHLGPLALFDVESTGVDPHRGRSKTLRIFVRTRDGQNRMFEYAEGSTRVRISFMSARPASLRSV